MADLEARILEDRALRNAARGVFDAGVGTVKADLAARSIGGRMADQATGQLRDVAGQAIDVAKESKGIIAGTFAALGLWKFREPLLAAAHRLFGDQASIQAEPLVDSETSGDPA
jgi:hypothetical protein